MATEPERLARIEEKLDRVVRAVEGNGQPGLSQRVGALERWRSGIVAVLAFLSIVTTAAVSVWAKLK